MKRVLKNVFLLTIILLFGSCTKNGVNKRKPYGVEINEFRSYYHAAAAAKRLQKEFKLPATVLLMDNNWYYVVAGAEKSIEKSRKFQRKIEKKWGFKDTKLFSYNNPDRVDFDAKKLMKNKNQFIKRNFPAVSDDVKEAIKMTPILDNFVVKRMSVMELPKNNDDMKRYSGIYSITTDLPRGITKKKLSKVAVTLSEAVLIDNLYGDRVTLNMVKLKLNHGINNGDVAGYFANLILNTNNYIFEDKKPIKIRSFKKLTGYEVVIEPRQNYYRTYYILFDKAEQWGVFVQSTDKSREELIDIVKHFGHGKGMLEYSSFNNTFMTMPDSSRLDPTEVFVGFTISKIGWSYAKSHDYAKWSKGYVGYWAAQGYYNNEKKGTWSYGVYDLLTKKYNQYTNALYNKAVAYKTSTVSVYGTRGRFVTHKKWSNNTYRYYDKAGEVNFIVDRYSCMVDNSEYSWLNKYELIDHANWLQVSQPGGYQDPETKVQTGTIKGFIKISTSSRDYTEMCVIKGGDGKEYQFPIRTRYKNRTRSIIGLKEYYTSRPRNDIEYFGKNLNTPVKFTWKNVEVTDKKTGEVTVVPTLLKIMRTE